MGPLLGAMVLLIKRYCNTILRSLIDCQKLYLARPKMLLIALPPSSITRQAQQRPHSLSTAHPAGLPGQLLSAAVDHLSVDRPASVHLHHLLV